MWANLQLLFIYDGSFSRFQDYKESLKIYFNLVFILFKMRFWRKRITPLSPGTGHKLKVHKTFSRRPGRLLKILYMYVRLAFCVLGVIKKIRIIIFYTNWYLHPYVLLRGYAAPSQWRLLIFIRKNLWGWI